MHVIWEGFFLIGGSEGCSLRLGLEVCDEYLKLLTLVELRSIEQLQDTLG